MGEAFSHRLRPGFLRRWGNDGFGGRPRPLLAVTDDPKVAGLSGRGRVMMREICRRNAEGESLALICG